MTTFEETRRDEANVEAAADTHARLVELEEILKEIKATMSLQEETHRELLMMYNNIRGFMQVLGWFESVSVWLAKMSVAAGIIWFLFKEGIRHASNKNGGQ